MNLMIINHSGTRIPRQFLQRVYKKIILEMKNRVSRSEYTLLNKKELVLVFLDTPAARKMNFQFRKKNYATDVLSFSSLEEGVLGELVLCPKVLKKQARQHRHSYRAELTYMILHGVLHLLGYEHETNKADAAIMFKLQDQVFENLQSLIPD